ncbi:transglutaminase-like putative cysteine protease [Sphingomonas kyeonggiensis]|uniref:transglutaminase family protein n=1 Tax=Sphingomonas kyeonggiensis TaxID=1268553 RepID=UPI0027810263|nr:transglutaminase family protein [Sphingomonas kyeonggiensis]MDQ0250856.1 transglutaminase-like putative cysteine protease [Sphingomonas kyeonggiensis]
MRLTILHETTYRYARAVTLFPHRMMLSPRGSHDLKLMTTLISCLPPADVEWTQDVFGNLIATASFSLAADTLTITSQLVVEQDASAWPVFPIAPHAHRYPFAYSHDERVDLGALLVPEHPDPEGRLLAWAQAIVAAERTDTLALLQDLNSAARAGIAYGERREEGTQHPLKTLDDASGACRDLATLFIEAARHLGFGARAVSGYLYDPPASGDEQVPQHGATHAWAEVYLPCAGWIAFDPTNARMGEANLVPVAVARNITQIPPLEGRYAGAPEDLIDMTVKVTVSSGSGLTARPGLEVRPPA